MLVHSFHRGSMWFEDYAAFAKHLGVEAKMGSLHQVPGARSPALMLGWVQDDEHFLQVELARSNVMGTPK